MTSKIYPVIHFASHALAMDQARLALEQGADGVFLISHDGQDKAVLQAAGQLRHAWSSLTTAAGEMPFVGVNLLNTAPLAALEFATQLRLDGLWLDAPGVNSHGPARQAKKMAEELVLLPQITVFASVAFKYQPEEPDPPQAAREALALGMLPTTSGPATGVAPDLAKTRAMSEAASGKLAVASGMTAENVSQYAPLLSHILVATGVALDEHRIDPQRLTRFIQAVRNAST